MSQPESLPDTQKVIDQIKQIPIKDYRMACLYDYAICGRPSEVVAQSYHSDQRSQARGPVGSDACLDRAIINSETTLEAVVFNVHTAKRKKRSSPDYSEGLLRRVALPVQYDPLALILLEYFKEFGQDPVFNFTRQELGRYCREHKVFAGFKCPIDEYIIFDNGQVKQTPSHSKNYSIGSLRHQRATDLFFYYGFEGHHLSAYGGWSIKSTMKNITSVMTRYLYINWQAYFFKLCRSAPYSLP